MKQKLLLFMKRILIVLTFSLLICAESMGQKVQWALEGTVTNNPFHCGLAVYRQDVNGKSLCGAINTSGEVAIQPQFDYLDNFYNGTAIAKQDDKYGIVSTRGYWILYPRYKYIALDKEHGFYEVCDDVGRKGIFYNGQFVVPIRYKKLYSYEWPFCSYEDDEGKNHSLNIFTGDLFDKNFRDLGNAKYIMRDSTYLFFNAETGERIDGSPYMKSSKGIEIFKDDQTKLYGFRNSKTKQIVIPPKYDGGTPFWINDMTTVTVNNPKHCEVINSDGKVIALDYSKDIFYQIKGDYITGFWEDTPNKAYYFSLYTKHGKLIIPLGKDLYVPIEGYNGWFHKDVDNPKIFDAVKNKYYPGIFYDFWLSEEGVAKIEDKTKEGKDQYYFIDLKNRKKLSGTYSKATKFSEGVAYVEKGKSPNCQKYFIDVSGKIIVKLNSDYDISYNGFSEGVIGVDDQTSYPWIKGYLFNPLGHKGYNYYASSNMKIDENIFDRWMHDGKNAYRKEHWGVAKDYFYRVMMNKPDHVEAITYYAACLNNLGYLDEAIEAYDIALDVDPTYSMAEEWKKTTIRNIENKELREREREDREERQAERSNMFWNALNSFSNMFARMYSSMNGDMPSSYISDRPLTDSPSVSGGNYQQIYQKWEKIAERHYNSLTNLGYSSKMSNGTRTGGTMQSMNSGNYVSMKISLREAQREMGRVRREAASHGITIRQSKWETATVSY